MSAINVNLAIQSVTSPNTVYTVPVQKSTSCTVNICNQNTSPVHVSVAISLTPLSPAPSEYIEYNAQIDANDILRESGLVLSTGYSLVVISDTANVSVNLWGFEEVNS